MKINMEIQIQMKLQMKIKIHKPKYCDQKEVKTLYCYNNSWQFYVQFGTVLKLTIPSVKFPITNTVGTSILYSFEVLPNSNMSKSHKS